MDESELGKRFSGVWETIGTPEHFQEFLKAANVPFIGQKMAKKVSKFASQTTFTIEGNDLTIVLKTKIKSQTRHFVIGNPEKEKEKNMIGKTNWARFAWEDGELVEYLVVASGKDVEINRSLESDDKVMRVITRVTGDDGVEVMTDSIATKIE